MLYYENKAKEKGFKFIVGVDEAGRGPLAGPVVASAVILKKTKFRRKICDSKKLNSRQREEAFAEILENAYVGIGIVDETIIDKINILRATHSAMSRAVLEVISKIPKSAARAKNLDKKICILVDGNSFISDLPYVFETIVKGDNLSLSIASASIIAKVTRDRILDNYDVEFPQYGFKQHKGYPTLAHRRALVRYGPTPIHRRTFQFKNDFAKD